jgi:predicted NUDIX family NTP pyrophosphohydrolase
VLLSQAGGAFGPKSDFGTLATPGSAVVGDFNSDGDPDLAAVSSSPTLGNLVEKLFGQPGGGFGATNSYVTHDELRSAAVGDFNDDGNPDLAVGFSGRRPDAGGVRVLLGRPDGGVASEADFPVGAGPISVAVGEFNGDGDPDLAVANQGSDDVSVLLGEPGGGFGPGTEYAAGHSPDSVAIGDFNGDGDPDLAVATSANITILVGQPGGAFAPGTDVDVDGPRDIVAGDFNGDGDPDLAITVGFPDGVSVLAGRSGDGFAPGTYVATGSQPTAIAVADFNGDGDQDMAVANRTSDSVSVLRNTSPPTAVPSPAAVDFPVTPVGSTSPRRDVTIANTGEGSLAVSAVAIVGGDADQFLISGETCTEGRVRPGEECVVSVRFRPVVEGPASATLRITDNAPDSPQRVTLTGTGGPPPVPAFSVSPPSVQFANQRVGTSSAPRRVTVTNTGTGPLAVGSTTIGGQHPASFAIAADTCQGRTVAAGGSCAVDVAFRPTAAGVRTGSLVFSDNAPGSPHSVALRGRGCLLLTGLLCL